MKSLIEYVAKAIVDQPEAVVVSEEASDRGVIIKLQVAPDDKGRVIGREGRVAEAMRTLLRVRAAKEGSKVRLEIL